MAAPNEPPRRVSMSYLLGLSNKPFKDPKPPPRPCPPPARGIDELLSHPVGIIEWVASDGRKGKLTGPGKSRSHSERSGKASSERGGDGGKGGKSKEDKKETAKGDHVAEDENPHGFTKEEDEKMLEWKVANGGKPWANFADEVGKSKEQCKERFNQIKPKDGNQNASKDQGGGGSGGGGKGNQGGGGGDGNQQQQEGRKLTKKEKAALKKEQKEGQGQQNNNNSNNQQNSSGNATDAWDNKTSGNDNTGGSGGNNNDTWGGMTGMFNEDDADKKSDKVNKRSDSDNNNAWGNAGGAGGWGQTSGEGNPTTWDNSNNNSGEDKKGGSTKGDNAWDTPGGTGGDGWNKTSGSNKAGSTKADGAWGGNGGDAWNTNESGGNNSGDAWGAQTGGSGGDTGWGETKPKPASNKGAFDDAWGTAGVNGAKNNSGDAWDTGNDQTNTNNNTGGGFDVGNTWGAPAAPTKSASKAPSYKAPSARHSHKSTHHHSTKERTNALIELEVKPDDVFSADDLRLVARVLQQDYQMVWNRVSWRFRDKTGRTITPEVFEKKITGQVEGQKKGK